MLAQLLYLAGTQGAPSLVPAISDFVLTSSAGACPGPLATNILNWSVINANDTFYEIHIVRDGALRATVACSATSYVDSIGLVQSTHFVGSSYLTFAFDVQLVRKSDSAVLTTLSASQSNYYEAC